MYIGVNILQKFASQVVQNLLLFNHCVTLSHFCCCCSSLFLSLSHPLYTQNYSILWPIYCLHQVSMSLEHTFHLVSLTLSLYTYPSLFSFISKLIYLLVFLFCLLPPVYQMIFFTVCVSTVFYHEILCQPDQNSSNNNNEKNSNYENICKESQVFTLLNDITLEIQ